MSEQTFWARLGARWSAIWHGWLAGLLGAAWLVLLLLLFSVALLRAGDPWSQWRASFDVAMTDCVKAQRPSCLSSAFASHPRPPLEGAKPDVSATLAYDLATARVLLRQKDAREALSRDYGIDGLAYLGTGYSVPLVDPGKGDYAAASQREYFVPNLCAEAVDRRICPVRAAHIWTWHLTPAQLQQWKARPVADLLAALAPQSGDGDFAARAAHPVSAAPALPALLIRFTGMSMDSYQGTVGRAGAVRVFFADLQQVRGKTLRDAMIDTGAAGLLAHADAGQTLFIWVYAPDANSQVRIASWKTLFALLAPH